MRTPGLAVVTTMLALTALCCSCSDKGAQDTYLRDRVNFIKEHTLPSDATGTIDSGLTLTRYSAAANWEFETHEERKAYLNWVREQLELANFKLQTSDESSLLLIKTSGGEADSIKIQVTPSNRALRVQVAVALDSD